MNNSNHFLKHHWLHPFIALVVASILITIFDVDSKLADFLYRLEGGHWAWQEIWITETFFHKGGRQLSLILAFLVLALYVTSLFLKSWASQRRPLAYLALSVIGGSLMVSILKHSLAISCPWEFENYGGHLPYTGVVSQLFLRNGEGCFPAGHASAGYAWIALYFFGLMNNSSLRWVGLLAALTAGIILGFVQQLRGAHFISHDLWTLAVCWFFSLSVYSVFTRKKSLLGLIINTTRYWFYEIPSGNHFLGKKTKMAD